MGDLDFPTRMPVGGNLLGAAGRVAPIIGAVSLGVAWWLYFQPGGAVLVDPTGWTVHACLSSDGPIWKGDSSLYCGPYSTADFNSRPNDVPHLTSTPWTSGGKQIGWVHRWSAASFSINPNPLPGYGYQFHRRYTRFMSTQDVENANPPAPGWEYSDPGLAPSPMPANSPDLLPTFVPMFRPIGAPLPHPAAPPVFHPVDRPEPWSPEFPEVGHDPSPEKPPRPGHDHEFRPPRPGEKERKGRLGPVASALWNGIGPITEAFDIVDIFYDALPDEVRDMYAPDLDPWEKFNVVYQHIEDLDVEKVIADLIANHFQDMAIGLLSQGLDPTQWSGMFDRPVGFGTGPAL